MGSRFYLTSICSANIGNARVLGMQAELGLTGGEYNWAVNSLFTVFQAAVSSFSFSSASSSSAM